jgi:serine/threonine protein kinase
MGCFNCGHQFAPAIRRGALIGGRYEVLDRLGSGMGTVYKAHDRVLDETVALKVLRPEIARSPDMEKRFRSEIKLARRVRHPNVCGIHEYGEDGEFRFISMELIEGIDLKQIIQLFTVVTPVGDISVGSMSYSVRFRNCVPCSASSATAQECARME